jgi:hypothetical protein
MCVRYVDNAVMYSNTFPVFVARPDNDWMFRMYTFLYPALVLRPFSIPLTSLANLHHFLICALSFPV